MAESRIGVRSQSRVAAASSKQFGRACVRLGTFGDRSGAKFIRHQASANHRTPLCIHNHRNNRRPNQLLHGAVQLQEVYRNLNENGLMQQLTKETWKLVERLRNLEESRSCFFKARPEDTAQRLTVKIFVTGFSGAALYPARYCCCDRHHKRLLARQKCRGEFDARLPGVVRLIDQLKQSECQLRSLAS